MTQLDKLSVKELEDYLRYQNGIFINDGKHFPSRIASQLIDTMRENERLRETIHQYNIQMQAYKQPVVNVSDFLTGNIEAKIIGLVDCTDDIQRAIDSTKKSDN